MAGNVDRKVLAHYVAELTGLERQRADIANDVRAKLRSAKAAGLAPEALRVILREQKLPPDVRSAQYRILDEYRAALGMLADTPLGEAAMARVESEGETVLEWPRKPFAEQTIAGPQPRGRQRKVIFDAASPSGRDSA